MISICIPTYNRVNLLSQLLETILLQTYTDFEIVITDNSDNDDTQKMIIEKFQDKRIRYYKNEKNLGLNANVIKCYSLIKGNYFTFTPDDDLWIDKEKLEKQIRILEKNDDVNIVYSNAESIDYNGRRLDRFASIYKDDGSIILNASELLPGENTKYHLQIATVLIKDTKDIFRNLMIESFSFGSEEYFCYYIAATQKHIGFLYGSTVALREAEHYRTAVEDGKIVDWKKRKDIRIRQIFNIYNTLTTLHPLTKDKLETKRVQNFLAKHLIGQACASRSIKLIFTTIASCYLFFRKFSLIESLKLSNKEGKSFG